MKICNRQVNIGKMANIGSVKKTQNQNLKNHFLLISKAKIAKLILLGGLTWD